MPGGNASLVRELSERRILSVLRRGEASKSEIADAVGLTTNTVGLICNELTKRGLVRAGAKRTGQRGHPATLISLDPTGAYAIGIKLGRRTQTSLLVDQAGRVIHSFNRDLALPTPADALSILAADVAALAKTLSRRSASCLAGIGLAMPYNLGNWRRELGIPEALAEAWSGVDFRAEMESMLDAPVFVENDGTAAAAAELFHGHGRSLRDFALIQIGYSIGGGLVLDGELQSGHTGNAGDFGLMPVGPSRLASAPRPRRGRPDILINRASGASLMRHLSAAGRPVSLTSELADAIAEAPHVAEAWLDDCVDALVRPIFALSSLLDLQAIVIGGLLPRSLLDRLVDRLRPALIASAPEARPPPQLLQSAFGRDAVARGAAWLPLDRAFGIGALLSTPIRCAAASKPEPSV